MVLRVRFELTTPRSSGECSKPTELPQAYCYSHSIAYEKMKTIGSYKYYILVI